MDGYPDISQIVDSDFVNALYQGENQHKWYCIWEIYLFIEFKAYTYSINV
jgi:hypothetical protein